MILIDNNNMGRFYLHSYFCSRCITRYTLSPQYSVSFLSLIGEGFGPHTRAMKQLKEVCIKCLEEARKIGGEGSYFDPLLD